MAALRTRLLELLAALPEDDLSTVADSIVDVGLRPCDACESAPATYVTACGFYGCDAHASAGAVDLAYAPALRALRAALELA